MRRDYYCKRQILCLASSKILTPHPPQRPASVNHPPLVRGEGGGGSIFWKTRDTALYCTYVRSLWSQASGQIFKRRRERSFLHLGYLLHAQLSYKPFAFCTSQIQIKSSCISRFWRLKQSLFSIIESCPRICTYISIVYEKAIFSFKIFFDLEN